MKYAVIYARYSSDRQNEMSIDGQIAECRRYAEAHDMVIVQEYIDKAQSATTDKRPEFLRMIADSDDRTFEIILVYQLDRFARNKDDSGYYKKILRENGVKVVSAMEHIASDSSGVITEGMLEIVADWYSKQLSEKVNRGLRQRAELAKFNGGGKTFGYIVNPEGYYELDPDTAPIVKEIFERTAEGEPWSEIFKDLAARGVKNVNGRPFSKNAFYRILTNERYKGVYKYDDIRIPGAIPRIISDELFAEVSDIVGARAYKSGKRPAVDDYLLTGKLFCGNCKTQMIGTSGTSKSGKTHRYYTCKNAPKKCKKKNIQKERIEKLIIRECQAHITDELIDEILDSIILFNKDDQEGVEFLRLKKEIKSVEDKIEKLLDQIESGNDSTRVAGRLKKREEELESLKRRLTIERSKQLKFDPEIVRRFLRGLREGDIEELSFRKSLIKAFIEKIYLYDDYFKIIGGFGDKKVGLTKEAAAAIEKEIDEYCIPCSKMVACSPPEKKNS